MSDNQNGQDRKSIIEKSMEKIRELRARGVNIDQKTIEKVLIAAGAGILVGGAVIAADYIDKHQKDGDSTHAVVKNVYTNLYKSLPDRNMVDRLDKNEMIIFTREQTEDWIQKLEDGEKKHVFIKIDKAISGVEVIDDDDEIKVTPQNVNRTKKYSNSELYVLQSSIDTYVECEHTPLLKFRKKANTTDEQNPMLASEGTLYVCLDSDGIGDHNFKKAVLVFANGDIEHGYVADENDYLSEKEDSTTCIGIANDYTYLRDSAALPEYDADYIKGLINNGDVIEITGEADQYCYTCKIVGDDENEYFIRKNTVIVFDDFDYEVEFDAGDIQYTDAIYGFANDGTLIERTNEDGSISTISKGDTLKVDINSSKDGYYSVYDEENGVVGFVDGNKIREKDSGLTITQMLEGKDAQSSTQENSSSNPNGASTQVNSENKATITVDCLYYSMSDLETLIEYYEKQGIEVSTVFFSIGSTMQMNDFGISNIVDTDNVAEAYKSDRTITSIQKTWDELEKNNGASINTSHRRGNMGELIEKIEYLIGKNIAIGMFYYSAPENESEVSCEAAYIYGVMKYINENSEAYRKYNRKLPLGIDVECNSNASRETSANTRRAELTQRLIELLGSGITADADKYFCIDNKSVGTGYGVISKEQGAIVYGDMRGKSGKLLGLLESNNGAVKSYWEMKSNLEEQGYNIYPWMSCQLSSVSFDSTKNLPLNDTIIGKMTDMSVGLGDLKATAENKATTEELKKLYKQAVIIQVMLQRSAGGVGHDISFAPMSNIDAMINGDTLPEDYSFEKAFSESINANKTAETNETQKNVKTAENPETEDR